MTTPWYKQFWPWFLILIPVLSFVMGFVMLHLATHTDDSLVVDDYYKEGRAINARLDKIEQAHRLNITTDLTINDGAITLKFHSGIPRSGEALQMRFFHVTLSDLDTDVLLSRDASGIYRGFVEQSLNGKWRVSLSPLDESWKIQQTLTLPRDGVIKFNP